MDCQLLPNTNRILRTCGSVRRQVQWAPMSCGKASELHLNSEENIENDVKSSTWNSNPARKCSVFTAAMALLRTNSCFPTTHPGLTICTCQRQDIRICTKKNRRTTCCKLGMKGLDLGPRRISFSETFLPSTLEAFDAHPYGRCLLLLSSAAAQGLIGFHWLHHHHHFAICRVATSSSTTAIAPRGRLLGLSRSR